MFREVDCPETPRLEVSGTKLAMLSFQHQGKEKTPSMPENETTFHCNLSFSRPIHTVPVFFQT